MRNANTFRDHLSRKSHIKYPLYFTCFFWIQLNLLFFHFRYLNDRMISYDQAFEVEELMAGSPGLQWPIGTVLTVKKTNSLVHDGNYTCAPSTLTTDSVIVHIIDEGKIPPAAVYGDSSRAFQTPMLTTVQVWLAVLISTMWWTLCALEKKKKEEKIVWKLEIQAWK